LSLSALGNERRSAASQQVWAWKQPVFYNQFDDIREDCFQYWPVEQGLLPNSCHKFARFGFGAKGSGSGGTHGSGSGGTKGSGSGGTNGSGSGGTKGSGSGGSRGSGRSKESDDQMDKLPVFDIKTDGMTAPDDDEDVVYASGSGGTKGSGGSGGTNGPGLADIMALMTQYPDEDDPTLKDDETAWDEDPGFIL